jgi:hypothetical protein
VDWWRYGLAHMRIVVACAAVAVMAAALTASESPATQAHSVHAPALVAAVPRCERRAVATSVARFTFLVDHGRYSDTVPLWLPKPRLPTPAFFSILGRNIRVSRGVEVPAAARRWVARGMRNVELLQIDPRVNEREPANYGFTMAWFASSASVGYLGEGKGVWDCEKRKIAMFVGSERRISAAAATLAESKAVARQEIAGRCGRRPRPIVRLYEQDVALCADVRGG